ncbi:MAG: fumarylacetoacetase [Planctomycetota bacterium]
MITIDHTHAPTLRSWVISANDTGNDFPIQNLPVGVFQRDGQESRCGVRIGDQILDLAGLAGHGLITGPAAPSCLATSLNQLMALSAPHRVALRHRLSMLLAHGAAERSHVEPHLLPSGQARMLLPATIGDYTDFYASIHHATNIGKMLRPDNPLLPNYKHIPIAYHGRSSSIVVSGTPINRPSGQVRNDPNAPPTFAASARLDYEVEIGTFVGPGNSHGVPIPIAQADDHIFGMCLLNDWSARDIQAWEYQPLGPFLAKNFATSISPWVVTWEALAPFRVAPHPRPVGDPAPLDYLRCTIDQARGAVDLTVEAFLSSAAMRTQGLAAIKLSRGSLRDLYWTTAQMLTHHASNGCNLRPGDLLGSGTISGEGKESWGSLMELGQRGSTPIELPSGERRGFLADGDELILTGYAQRDGCTRIGLGECRGLITSVHGS